MLSTILFLAPKMNCFEKHLRHSTTQLYIYFKNLEIKYCNYELYSLYDIQDHQVQIVHRQHLTQIHMTPLLKVSRLKKNRDLFFFL